MSDTIDRHCHVIPDFYWEASNEDGNLAGGHLPARTAHLGRADAGAMKLAVNGAEVEVDDRHAKTPLLGVLRDVVGHPMTICRRGGSSNKRSYDGTHATIDFHATLAD